MNKGITILALAAMLGLPAAFADESHGKNDSDGLDCIQTQRIHTVRRLDERHVVAELLGGKRYVLGVEARCRGLENAVQFTVTSRGTRVCPASFAELIFVERSGRSDECRIETLEQLTTDDEVADPQPDD